MKTQILAAVGENGLQQATALNAGLAANDRVKYALTLLQMALEHAQHPEQQAVTLKHERLACGIDDTDLGTTVSGARDVGKACRIPGAAGIMTRIADDMRLMATPVSAAGETGFGGRLTALLGAMPGSKDDLVEPGAISAMMQAGHGTTDSLHRLVMELHKRPNALQAAMAQETVDSGRTSHASVVARQLGKVCLVGCPDLEIDLARRQCRIGGVFLNEGDMLALDGNSGAGHAGQLSVTTERPDAALQTIASWQCPAAA